MPDALKNLYNGNNPQPAHFLKYIRPYNNSFAFTSIGVTLDPEFAKSNKGIYTFQAQGAYHFLNHLYPSTNTWPSYLQLCLTLNMKLPIE